MASKPEQHDPLAERLSSLFDDECDAAEIDAILAEEEAVWQQKMQAYALTSAVLSSDTQHIDYSATDLLSRVNKGIEALEEQSTETSEKVVSIDQFQASDIKHSDKAAPQTPVAKRHFMRQAFSGLALAASVAFVVIGGGSYLLNGSGQEAAPALAQTPSLALPVDIKPLQQVSAEVDVDSKRLQSYLRQHAEQSTMAAGQGMLPMARVVSYPVEEK